MQIEPSYPSRSVVSAPRSSSKHVLRSSLMKIYPESQISYSYSTNSEIRFSISSPSMFWDPIKSYLRFGLECSLFNEGNDDTNKYLAEGGGHAIFSRLEIHSAAGTLIERIDDYNRLYSMLSTATHSPDYVDSQLAMSGDSISYTSEAPVGHIDEPIDLTVTNVNTVTYTNATKTVAAITGGRIASELRVGDIVQINSFTATVATIVSDVSFTIVEALGADITATNVLSLRRLASPSRSQAATRKFVANPIANQTHTITLQLSSPFLTQGNLIPLFLMRGGIEIRLTLARPEFVLATTSPPLLAGGGAGFTGADVVVSQPEFMCHMLQPDQSLQQLYMQLYNSERKLSYFFIGYKRFLDVLSSAERNASLSLSSNVRSAKYYLARIQDTRAQTVGTPTATAGKSTFTCDSIAQGLSASINRFQLTSGSEHFPQSAESNYSSADKHEASMELQRVFASAGMPFAAMRCKPYEWRSRAATYAPLQSGNRADSQRLILAADMSRDHSPFSGTDLSLNQLQVSMTFSADYELTELDGSANVGANKYVLSYIAHDAAMSLSSDGIVVYS